MNKCELYLWLCRSQFNYQGAVPKQDSFTSNYAYFKRDTRRSFPPTVSVTSKSISGLLPVPEGYQSLAVKSGEPVVPGHKRQYRRADDQPPAEGYFPIINCE